MLDVPIWISPSLSFAAARDRWAEHFTASGICLVATAIGALRTVCLPVEIHTLIPVVPQYHPDLPPRSRTLCLSTHPVFGAPLMLLPSAASDLCPYTWCPDKHTKTNLSRNATEVMRILSFMMRVIHIQAFANADHTYWFTQQLKLQLV